jgi:hypothetical protein
MVLEGERTVASVARVLLVSRPIGRATGTTVALLRMLPSFRNPAAAPARLPRSGATSMDPQ